MADLHTPATSEMQKQPIFPSDSIKQRKGVLRLSAGAEHGAKSGGLFQSSSWSGASVSRDLSPPSSNSPRPRTALSAMLQLGALSWLLPLFWPWLQSPCPWLPLFPSLLSGSSGSSLDVFTSYCTHPLGVGLHSFPQFSPSVANCPSLQISHLLDKLLSCALGLCMQSSEALCLERNPSYSLPNPFLILHSTSVKRSTIHHLEIWELPMLPLCPHPLESVNHQVLSHLLP